MTATEQLRTALSGRYIVERELGAGGMATVYLAEDVRHRRKVALKVLHPELSAVLGPERFLKEIELTANLQHPHILPLFDSGSADGLLYYVMPYVRGETLRERLTRERQLPVDEAVRIAAAAASALDYAHREGVVHRDLKPENILLQDGQPLLADFGIALAISTAGGARITQTGLSLGTPQYMSPEQATADRAIDGRTDIYSLGAVVHEMLTGDPPHTGSTAQAIIARVLTEAPRDIRATRPSVPVHVSMAVSRALEKLPADRWATAHDFAEALEGRISTPAPAGAADRGSGQRRLARRAAALLPWALLVVLAGAAGTLYHRARSQPAAHVTWFSITNVDSARLTGAALSPDGSMLVLAARGSNDTSRLYVRRLDDPVPHPLLGGERGSEPFFSGDGQWIGFQTNDGNLMRVPVGGGTPSLLGELARPSGASWDAHGVVVTGMSTDFKSASFNGLWRVSADSGAPRHLTRPAPGTMHHMPVLLGDGETVLFQLMDNRGFHLAVGSLRSGEFASLGQPAYVPIGVADGQVLYQNARGIWAAPFDVKRRRITGAPVHVQDLLGAGADGWTPAWLGSDGTLAYFIVHGTEQPLLVDLPGRVETLPPIVTFFPRFSPDGRKIAFIAPGSDAGLYVYDIAARTYARLSAVTVPIESGLRGAAPVWSPDGSRVAFSPNLKQGELWWQAADGSGAAEKLVTLPAGEQIGPSSFSPDGKSLAITVVREDTMVHRDIYIASLSGPATLTPFIATPLDEFWPRWSPDGKWIAYQSNETGLEEVYVRAYPGGERVRISESGGSLPAWTSDGRVVYRSGGRILAATLAKGGSGSMVASRTVLYAGRLAPASEFSTFDVAPNGQRLVVWGPANAARTELVVGVNWRQAVLERRLK